MVFLAPLDDATGCGRVPQWRTGPVRLFDCGLGDRIAQLAMPADTQSPQARASAAGAQSAAKEKGLTAVNRARVEEFEMARLKLRHQ
jgi:hypothetical protein